MVSKAPPSSSQIRQFQRHVFSWWEKNKRDLPWRHTNDPYKILISEVMLQQTQVSRVLPKYREFLQTFPTVAALAAAPPARIIQAWKGMGYNRRALYLGRMAKTIMTKHHGRFPSTEKELVGLPGIGRYTARAVLVFAFRQQVAMVDTNIRQIIQHYFFEGVPQSEKAVQQTADMLIPQKKAWEWHQALMDYGALELSKKRKKQPPSRPVLPFRETARFYRGRNVGELRQQSRSRNDLADAIKAKYKKSSAFTNNILTSLLRDGLIEESSPDYFRLPAK